MSSRDPRSSQATPSSWPSMVAYDGVGLFHQFRKIAPKSRVETSLETDRPDFIAISLNNWGYSGPSNISVDSSGNCYTTILPYSYLRKALTLKFLLFYIMDQCYWLLLSKLHLDPTKLPCWVSTPKLRMGSERSRPFVVNSKFRESTYATYFT